MLNSGILEPSLGELFVNNLVPHKSRVKNGYNIRGVLVKELNIRNKC